VALTSRAPSLVERYLWTPSNASAGLADGRTYMGSLGLNPETAVETSITARHETDTWYASAAPFYRVVDDYITGLVTTRPGILTYTNIDRADFYGIDFAAGTELPWNFALDSHLSHVTTRNRDQGGDLYRIAPLHGLVDLSWKYDRWACHLECQWAAAQNHVSTLQNELPTPGYAVWNLRVGKEIFEAIRIETGVENLLDHRYSDHLGGINRVSGSDVGLGEKIPSAGRFAYVMLGWSF
jgi:iron complex outermembrane receptor protein